jgi:glutamate synthase domain-containing protein 3
MATKTKSKKAVFDAKGVYYRDLNEQVRQALADGATEIEINNVVGQRYLAGGIGPGVTVTIRGVAGQDACSFMRGAYARIQGNAQDGVGNTMDSGKVVIEGMAGDVLGYAMRGGKIYVTGDVGYRVGIHMKAYMDKFPMIIVGGKAGDFLGEYMAGGAIILLGVNSVKPDAPLTGRSLGTGMHGGVIYIRGQVPEHQLGPGLHFEELEEEDKKFLEEHITDYAKETGMDAKELLSASFSKIKPYTHRPYGNMYVGTN